MHYGFDEEFRDNLTIIQPGIHENMFLKEVNVSLEDDENKYIEFVFNDKDNTYYPISRRYYEPKMGGFVDTEDKLVKAVNRFNSVMANISRNLLGNKYTVVGVKTFDEFIMKVKRDLQAAINKVPVRLVVVLNNNDFPTLRSFSPVIESMSIVPSKLALSRFDKIESDAKQKPADEDPIKESIWD